MDSSIPASQDEQDEARYHTDREEPVQADRVNQAEQPPLGVSFALLYALANAVIGIGNITYYTLLLPERLVLIAPQAQTSAFIVLSALGALASILTNPLVGALSDRTPSVLGRRLPWILVGGLLLLLAMLCLALASSLFVLGIGSVLLQIAINVLLAALSAIIPDQVPLRQRATISALSGMAPLVGGLIGQIIVGQLISGSQQAFLVLGQVSLIILLLFCLRVRDRHVPASPTPLRLVDVPRALWLSPRRYPDFALTWLARCLIFLASTTVVNYMYYYLQDGVRLPQTDGIPVAQGVQIFYTLYVISLLVASLIAGRLSDRLQRRKPFVIGASMLMAVGMALFACFPFWQMVLVATVILGLGFGTYLSVDLALASQLLPEAKQHGKDIGLINTAIFLPMLIAPLLVGVALGQGHSYALLFGLIAFGTVLAAGLIVPIRQVR